MGSKKRLAVLASVGLIGLSPHVCWADSEDASLLCGGSTIIAVHLLSKVKSDGAATREEPEILTEPKGDNKTLNLILFSPDFYGAYESDHNVQVECSKGGIAVQSRFSVARRPATLNTSPYMVERDRLRIEVKLHMGSEPISLDGVWIISQQQKTEETDFRVHKVLHTDGSLTQE
jgi:hypothetical protein